MDPRLKNAIEQGRQDAADAEAIKVAKRAEEYRKEQEYIESKISEAREYFNNCLFKEIARIEASGSSYKRIDLNTNYIPGKSYCKAAEEIEGIRIESNFHFSGGYEDQSGEGYWEYWVEWGDK